MNICVETYEELSYGLYSPMGGEGRWITSIGKCLAIAGHSVDILCENPEHNNKINDIPNVTYRNWRTDRNNKYDIYLCQGWGVLYEPQIRGSLLNICCMFVLEHVFYKRVYWEEIARREQNWVIAYPFETQEFQNLFLGEMNPLRDISFPLPWVAYFEPLSDHLGFDSKKIAFSARDIETRYSDEYKESYRRLRKILENDKRFEVVDFPRRAKYQDVFAKLNQLHLLFNFNESGSGYEAVLSGIVPFFAYKPAKDILIPNVCAMKPKTQEADFYLEYPLQVDKVLNMIEPVSTDKERYRFVIEKYRELLKNNSWTFVLDCFKRICERFQ